MISKDDKELARMKQVEAYHYLGALACEEAITQATYNAITDNILWVLHNIIDELDEGDLDGKEDSEEDEKES
jgi:hypothetical protein